MKGRHSRTSLHRGFIVGQQALVKWKAAYPYIDLNGLDYFTLPRDIKAKRPLVPCPMQCGNWTVLWINRHIGNRCLNCRNIARRTSTAKTRTGYRRQHGKFVHKIIAEKAIGRPLKRYEVVHHIDLNKQNNRNDNLLICSQSYHLMLHRLYEKAWVSQVLNGGK